MLMVVVVVAAVGWFVLWRSIAGLAGTPPLIDGTDISSILPPPVSQPQISTTPPPLTPSSALPSLTYYGQQPFTKYRNLASVFIPFIHCRCQFSLQPIVSRHLFDVHSKVTSSLNQNYLKKQKKSWKSLFCWVIFSNLNYSLISRGVTLPYLLLELRQGKLLRFHSPPDQQCK